MLASMILLLLHTFRDVQVGPHDMTLNMDEKHCLKRVRERIKSNTQSIVVGKTTLDLASHHFFLKAAGCDVIDSLLSPIDSMNVQVCFLILFLQSIYL
jgi:hypothetical protein